MVRGEVRKLCISVAMRSLFCVKKLVIKCHKYKYFLNFKKKNMKLQTYAENTVEKPQSSLFLVPFILYNFIRKRIQHKTCVKF